MNQQQAAAPRLGRRAAALVEVIRDHIATERIAQGQYLPSERQFARRYGANKNTVRCALKALERDGVVEAVPRHGYRVAVKTSEISTANRCLVAYIPVELHNLAARGPTEDQLQLALRSAASQRGWSLLSVTSLHRAIPEILTELRTTRVSGVVLDNAEPALAAAIRHSGIPLVMADAWDMAASTDSIVQDGELGGLLASQYLLNQGCRRIAWFGINFRDEQGNPNMHSLDRFHGVHAGLALNGLDVAASVFTATETRPIMADAQVLLTRTPRPDGIVALWTRHTTAILQAAREMRLRLGRDIHIVGWCMEEAVASYYLPAFVSGPVPPYVTWSAKTLATAAVDRLAERIRRPDLPFMRIKIPVRLVIPE